MATSDTSSLGFEAGFGTGNTFGTGAEQPQFTWQDLIKMFANSSGVSPTGVNSQQLPFAAFGNKQQNPGVPMYNPLQPLNVPEEQQKQSSIADIAKYVQFFQSLF